MKELVLTTVLMAVCAHAASAQTTEDLKRLSLADLMKIEVTTVTRVPETIARVPAAVFVITADDIRRSGATSIPDALRLAPGVHVARMDAGRWAIGMRGFADRLARAMLVLIDGRAVYSPLFAGTYWEVQDTLLEDIDRIEIIRGPGGTLWGANAVTGIINIVTKPARTTRGVLVSAAAGGPVDRASGGLRFGGGLGTTGDYRAYVKAFHRGPLFRPSGTDEFDDWNGVQAGFRADWSPREGRQFTVQGDAYRAVLGQRVALASFAAPFNQTIARDAPLTGGNVLGRWTEQLSADTALQFQTYYDRTARDEQPVAETRDTFDIDVQLTHTQWARHAIAWGVGVRASSGRIDTVGLTAFAPPDRTDMLWNAFAQDDIALVPDRLQATVGAKFEHNEYSGAEVQPSVRLTWTPHVRHTVVWSMTRAVRTPSRVETDYTTTSLVSAATPSFVRLLPNPDFVPEELRAYELGYRVTPGDRLYATVAAFYNQHDRTLSTELLPSIVESDAQGPPRLILPVTFANGLHGRSYGFEATADLRITPWWRATSNYAYLRVEMTRNPGGNDVTQEATYERRHPRHQIELQTALDLPRGVTVNWFLRYVSALRTGNIPAYSTSDVRVGWQLAPRIEVAVVGRDLHDARHAEWPGALQVRRSAFVQVILRR